MVKVTALVGATLCVLDYWDCSELKLCSRGYHVKYILSPTINGHGVGYLGVYCKGTSS